MSRRTREHRHRRRRPAAKHRPSRPPLGPSARAPISHGSAIHGPVAIPSHQGGKQPGGTIIALVLGGSIGLLAAGVMNVWPTEPDGRALSARDVASASLIAGAWGWHLGSRRHGSAGRRHAALPPYLGLLLAGIALLAATPAMWVARTVHDAAHAWFVLPGLAGALIDGAGAFIIVGFPTTLGATLLSLREAHTSARALRLVAALLACVTVYGLVEVVPHGIPTRVAMQAAALPCLIAACVLALRPRESEQPDATLTHAAPGSPVAYNDGSSTLHTALLLAVALAAALAAMPVGSGSSGQRIAEAAAAVATMIGLTFGMRQARTRWARQSAIGLVAIVAAVTGIAAFSLHTFAILKPGTLSAALGIGARASVGLAAGAALRAAEERRASANQAIDGLMVRAMLIGGLSLWLAESAPWPMVMLAALGLLGVGIRLARTGSRVDEQAHRLVNSFAR